jgi:hypothetical protein
VSTVTVVLGSLTPFQLNGSSTVLLVLLVLELARTSSEYYVAELLCVVLLVLVLRSLPY